MRDREYFRVLEKQQKKPPPTVGAKEINLKLETSRGLVANFQKSKKRNQE